MSYCVAGATPSPGSHPRTCSRFSPKCANCAVGVRCPSEDEPFVALALALDAGARWLELGDGPAECRIQLEDALQVVMHKWLLECE
eukprot:294720-Prymnesium_polylepis.1